jgi:hypothetical protein
MFTEIYGRNDRTTRRKCSFAKNDLMADRWLASEKPICVAALTGRGKSFPLKIPNFTIVYSLLFLDLTLQFQTCHATRSCPKIWEDRGRGGVDRTPRIHPGPLARKRGHREEWMAMQRIEIRSIDWRMARCFKCVKKSDCLAR